jgi:hypothetical protein
VVLFTFSHRITSDREAPFLHLHHPRFQGFPPLIYFILFYKYSLFGLYAPPSSSNGHWAQSDPLLPHLLPLHIPPARMSRPSRPLLWRHNTIVPYCILYTRFQISFAPTVWTAGHPASSACHCRHRPKLPSHPVVQAQPNFKLDLSLLNWHFKIT